jgi:hypothetical protein
MRRTADAPTPNRPRRAGPALALVLVAACAAPSAVSAARTLPPANGRFDYQIGGPYTPDSSVQIVDRDRTDSPVPGKYNICYINAFQTQAEDVGWWRSRHAGLLLKKSGRAVVDSAWNEILLDTSTASRRRGLARIVGRWMDGCRKRGYQAVEPDNLDSYSRSKNVLTLADNKAYASLLIRHAHARGLAIAQKNTSELGRTGKRLGFDFAIAEECNAYDECGAYTGAYGRRVYEIEYPDNGGMANYDQACAARGSRISIIYRDRDVVPGGRSDYVYRAC